MEDNKDVEDLYEELKSELNKDSEEEESSGASAQKPEDVAVEEDPNAPAELSEEEISALSPRAQKRIRELAEKVKEFAEAPAVEETPTPTPEDITTPHDFKNVQEFLAAVEDEPSRKLLETFYTVIKGETSSILAPIEQKNNETRFDNEFSKYEVIDGLSDYKNDLKKTFLRDPSKDPKALIAEVVTDLQLNRIKPIESTESTPNRDGKVDTSNMDLEQLYETLDTLKA